MVFGGLLFSIDPLGMVMYDIGLDLGDGELGKGLGRDCCLILFPS